MRGCLYWMQQGWQTIRADPGAAWPGTVMSFELALEARVDFAALQAAVDHANPTLADGAQIVGGDFLAHSCIRPAHKVFEA
jgi:hypothetical protein